MSEIKYISTPNAPQPAGHYSQAVVHNGLVFVAGQLAIAPSSKHVISSPTPRPDRSGPAAAAGLLAMLGGAGEADDGDDFDAKLASGHLFDTGSPGPWLLTVPGLASRHPSESAVSPLFSRSMHLRC